MTFKIILTVLAGVNIISTLDDIDKPREPIKGWIALLNGIANGIIIYGFWNWL